MRISPLICSEATFCFCAFMFYAATLCYCNNSKAIEVVGFGECADCKQTNINTDHAFLGLRVTVHCKAVEGRFEMRGVGELDKEGKFKVLVSDDIVKDGQLKEKCYAQLHSASNAPCPLHTNGFESSKVVTNEEKHSTLRVVGKLKFSARTCASAFLWPHFMYPTLPKWPHFHSFPYPYSKSFGHPFPFRFFPPKKIFNSFPPKRFYPFWPPFVPLYKKPIIPVLPYPIFNKPLSPPSPFYKKLPPPPTPIDKEPVPPPVPRDNTSVSPPGHEDYEPLPPPDYENPLSPSAPIYNKEPILPPPPPVSIDKKPLAPLLPNKPPPIHVLRKKPPPSHCPVNNQLLPPPGPLTPPIPSNKPKSHFFRAPISRDFQPHRPIFKKPYLPPHPFYKPKPPPVKPLTP